MTSVGVEAPIVSVTGGRVSGRTVDGVSSYLGIPYAAPPIGGAAFAAPAPVPAWDGVRAATDYGPTAPQVPYLPPISELLDNVIVLGADYLNLNVWTPDPGASGLPVMVWIHGGAFSRGSNRIAMYAGDTFARDGVVFVGINYRLGTAGFASIDGAPENRGLRDQIAALGWVQDNITAFGGDPANVTVVGESAGAMSVASLLASPITDGLFRRGVMQSGNAAAVCDPADARKVTQRLASILGVDATPDAIAALPVDTLLTGQSQLSIEMSVRPDPELWGASVASAGLGIMAQFPVVDGEVLTSTPRDAIAAGAGSSIPLLAGWNADEFRFFLVAYGGTDAVTEQTAAGILGRAPGGVDYLRQRLADGTSPGEILTETLTAHAFSVPTTAIATARSNSPTHLYEFGYQSPRFDIRAGHAVEIPFVFDHLADAHPLVGPEPDQQLADEMHRTWVRFAHSGDPGWMPLRDGAQAHRFG